jgi:hypothetical protein
MEWQAAALFPHPHNFPQPHSHPLTARTTLFHDMYLQGCMALIPPLVVVTIIAAFQMNATLWIQWRSSRNAFYTLDYEC